ncbi:hypothetical protein AB3M83_02950 [Microbacterium sp. 179-B 1A2 NHS]|uniref:hypothetical protein n=1 Tax=Microbacterium sp. 179-B 1A2 NHS TaxID=3142383 RepID=UPI0039A2656F
MLKLHYSDGSVTTTDAVADAVMRYARSLAAHDESDLVTIPIVEDGIVGTSTMLIGPASQLHTTPYDGPAPEMDEEPFLMELLRKGDLLLHPPSPPVDNRDDDAPTGEAWDVDGY